MSKWLGPAVQLSADERNDPPEMAHRSTLGKDYPRMNNENRLKRITLEKDFSKKDRSFPGSAKHEWSYKGQDPYISI